MSTFTIGEQDFLLDGQPHRVLSGAIHYFRVHPEQWADRIHKARLMGLNTIETYVAWNAHSPSQGEFVTEGGLDLGRFLDLIAAEGMHAIVRPGPYICAEWDNGGLPAWLFRNEGVGIRRSEPLYLAAVTEYLERVYEIVRPRQIGLGGPVILVQIENEYGAYGSDKEYLQRLVEITRDACITVPLTTIDQPTHQMLQDGSLPGLHLTGSFGSRALERLETLRDHQPTGPLVCMEFWNGWFDDWGTHHHTTSAESSASELDDLLTAGASVNFYMFHGGTNFGLTSGANDKGKFAPIVTSYDYDAPLDEAGNPTDKFFAFRDVIAKHFGVPDEEPARATDLPALTLELDERASLFDVVDRVSSPITTTDLPTFDDLRHDSGLAVFSTQLSGDGPGLLSFGEIRDRAWVHLDGVFVGVLSRENSEHSLVLPRADGELTVVVENQGRVNYGPRLGEHKGIIGGATLDGKHIEHWMSRPLDLDRVASIALEHDPSALSSVVARGAFELATSTDLFLDTSGWGKGFAWLNGFALGRYWRRGPQRTLYVPAPVTRAGSNALTILELEVLPTTTASFVPRPSLGPTEF